MDKELFATDSDPIVEENVLEELVGEGKKFKDASELAKGKLMADKHIAKLEAEMKALREELTGRVKLEDFIDRLEKSKEPNSAQMHQNTKSEDTTVNETTSKGLTIEDLEKFYSEKSKAATQEANLQTVASKMREMYGEDFQRAATQRAGELGISKERLLDLARNEPNAFLNIMKPMGEQKKKQDPAQGLVFGQNYSAETRAKSSPSPKFSDFMKMRKENPDKYNSKAVRDQIFRFTQEYGSDFLNS